MAVRADWIDNEKHKQHPQWQSQYVADAFCPRQGIITGRDGATSAKRPHLEPELIRSEVARGPLHHSRQYSSPNLEPMAIGHRHQMQINRKTLADSLPAPISIGTGKSCITPWQLRRGYQSMDLSMARHSTIRQATSTLAVPVGRSSIRSDLPVRSPEDLTFELNARSD